RRPAPRVLPGDAARGARLRGHAPRDPARVQRAPAGARVLLPPPPAEGRLAVACRTPRPELPGRAAARAARPEQLVHDRRRARRLIAGALLPGASHRFAGPPPAADYPCLHG